MAALKSLCLCLLMAVGLMPVWAVSAEAQTKARTVTRLGDFSLSIGLVNDDVWVFEISPEAANQSQPFESSIMLKPGLEFSSPQISSQAFSSQTVNVRMSQDPPAIIVSRQSGAEVFSISPYAPDGQLTGLSFFNPQYSHLAGLGADFQNANEALNLLGLNIKPASPFGNSRVAGFGGRPNQVQIPLVYGLGEGKDCGAVFVDETRPLQWSFSGKPWIVSTAGPLGPKLTFRFFVITGENMAELRKHFMAISGRPPVPPAQAFGVWAGAIRAADETEWRDKVGYLNNTVPGLTGVLATKGLKTAELLETARNLNLSLMADESVYLPQEDPKYTDMAQRSYLVRRGGPSGPTMVVTHKGDPSALIDYTNNAGAAFWHSLERRDQVAAGLSVFRLTDGDLPNINAEAWYFGQDNEGQVHSHYALANTFALKWQENLLFSVSQQRIRSRPRLMLLNRTGLAGLARLNGALYNGEASLFALRYAPAIRSHLALSGIDYYSSDISHNLADRPLEQNSQQYDTWLAKNVLTDIPLVLPEEVLLKPSAAYNLTLRDNLRPYYYSLAWEAYLSGQPVLAPLMYYFQDDLTARSRSGEMMLGPSLLIGLGFDGAGERTSVYVPQGRWYNWRTGEVVNQEQGGLVSMDLKDFGHLTPPILARAGAIIPGAEEFALKGGVPEAIPSIKIFIGDTSSEFTWYEDDGKTMDYQSRRIFGKTQISAVTNLDGSTVVTIKARQGDWEGAPSERRFLVDIYGPQAPGEATLDGLPHNRVARSVELDQLDSGWASIGTNRIRFKTPYLDTGVDHVLWFK